MQILLVLVFVALVGATVLGVVVVPARTRFPVRLGPTGMTAGSVNKWIAFFVRLGLGGLFFFGGMAAARQRGGISLALLALMCLALVLAVQIFSIVRTRPFKI